MTDYDNGVDTNDKDRTSNDVMYLNVGEPPDSGGEGEAAITVCVRHHQLSPPAAAD